jgi:hypothetical protein
MTASAGPRVFPPSVTELAIDFDEKVSEIESSAKSAALADGVAAKHRAETRMIRRIINKSYSCCKERPPQDMGWPLQFGVKGPIGKS